MNSCFKKNKLLKKIFIKKNILTVNESINCAQNAYRNFRSAIVKYHKLSYSDDGKNNLFQYYNLVNTKQ